ncbi:GGDEF domain-containing protein [Burkholderia gladioli]|uniref:diguanylate cyclase n=1 Tax=Burkholderia gladioli (strain BSR3) TaxID=999541 RepID=F2LN84_BURGS|nr:GGDEF domain-containing protein [Burkholderia gladioli]AEA64047.1 diguanylate cyclase [Burkholderia gladioli BSR3]MBA1364531.1 diguanylate cyclase [Burkholderia gladioli]MBW5285673.1 GGDEF domain-containing protein [Burkholderia gladioli]POS06314.1 GGDEF domain-containing protein [Burkholderia gladioli]
MRAFRSASIGRRLWWRAILAILLVAALAILALGQVYEAFSQARHHARLLRELRVLLDVANDISSERAPSNVVMTASGHASSAAVAWLARGRAKTDRDLDAASARYLSSSQAARVKRRLAEARRLVDLRALQVDPPGVDVQDSIDAMFAAYDAMHDVVAAHAANTITSTPSLQGAVLQAMALAEVRDAAGRLGSCLVASMATHTPLSERNLENIDRLSERIRVFWWQSGLDERSVEIARRRAEAWGAFARDGLPLIDSLTHAGRRARLDTMTVADFTARYVQALRPLEDMRRHYLETLVDAYVEQERYRLVLLVVAALLALVVVALVAGLMSIMHFRVLRPLLEVSEAVITLADETRMPKGLRRNSARELQVLFDAFDILESRMRERASLAEKLKRQAQTDALTKLFNRRAFETFGQIKLRGADPAGQPFLILLDLDHFKSINDRFGHPVGDGVLVKVADALASQVRPGDLVARFGGEEFVVLLHAVDVAAALSLAERLLAAIRAVAVFAADGTAVPVTASLGVASGSQLSLRQLLSHADLALYEAKRLGRDRIRMFGLAAPA